MFGTYRDQMYQENITFHNIHIVVPLFRTVLNPAILELELDQGYPSPQEGAGDMLVVVKIP